MPQPINRTIQTLQALDSDGNVVEVLADASGNLLVSPGSDVVFETKETASQNREMVNILRNILDEIKVLNMHHELVTENHFHVGDIQ